MIPGHPSVGTAALVGSSPVAPTRQVHADAQPQEYAGGPLIKNPVARKP